MIVAVVSATSAKLLGGSIVVGVVRRKTAAFFRTLDKNYVTFWRDNRLLKGDAKIGGKS